MSSPLRSAPGGPAAPATPDPAQSGTSCPDTSAGLILPPGFCATVFADNLGRARHLVVAPGGVVYVNTWSGRYYGNRPPPAAGFLIALQDTQGSGKADVVKRFGASPATGGHGGTGIGFYKNAIYAEESDRIERYALSPGSIVPTGKAEVVVSGLPLGGDHPMHPFAIDADGELYIDVATATNACQPRNRVPHSRGLTPCTELHTRGGIWRYDANKSEQKFSRAERYATGIRNADGIAIDASGRGVYATQHGRDQLHENWPELYPPEEEATQPAEELLRVRQGADYGWPECYFDEVRGKLVLAPEYGGDGGKTVGVCASKKAPVASFPAHWAPNDVTIYSGHSFPARYWNGAFIAFHGSWDRAPYPQGGYNIVYQVLGAGGDRGQCEVFADGFAGPDKDPGKAEHRPSGVAVAPDGALFVSDDQRGRIYRITYTGTQGTTPVKFTPCPPPDAPAGPIGGTSEKPPEAVHPNAGAATAQPKLLVPPGSSERMVALGDEVYHGKVGAATCTGCHGSDGSGSPVGPPLNTTFWLWGDGSYDSIRRTVTNGVPIPKRFRSPMPPMGGARLTQEQVDAVSAYVWALSHH
jgi:glucose/arabinose dehydrogenase/mono/diheme cytochrome c family protein